MNPLLGPVYTMDHKFVPRQSTNIGWLLNSTRTTSVYTRENMQRNYGGRGPQSIILKPNTCTDMVQRVLR